MGPRRRDGRSLAIAAALVVAAGLAVPSDAGADASLVARFDGPDRLITDEFATWNPQDPRAHLDRVWEVGSGSLSQRHGQAWTDSEVFRAVTRRDDLQDVQVHVRIGFVGFTPTDDPHDWDGIHLFLRYRGEAELYAVSVVRRDGRLEIKRKLPGGPSNGGTYRTLAESAPRSVRPGSELDVVVSIETDPRGQVRIALVIDGVAALSAVDDGEGGAPIDGPGRVGIRGDATELTFDDLVVTPLR